MTVQEWLGADNQLGIDIWTKKYQYNNETFDSWLDRISNGDQEVRQLIMDKKFLFGGRILSNRGLYKDGIKTTYSNCFTGDTRVKTINGYKPIKDIKKGELVQTIDGSYQKVNETMSRNYDGDIYTFTSPQLLRKISCTPNHTFFTQTKEWIDAKSIYEIAQHPKKNNYKLATLNYLTPINECSETIDIVNDSAILNHITAYWTKHREIQNDNNLIWTSCNYIGGNKAKGIKESKPINRFITIDNDLLYLFGRYLGDGSITMRDDTLSIFQIVFNAKKELEAYNRCKKIIEEHFGIICYDNSNIEQNTLVLKFDSVLACGFIDYYCGHKESKHFPEQYKNNINIALGLIDSDGTVISSGALKVALANETLLNDLYNCLLNNNITCNSPRKKLQSDKIHYSYNINYSVLQTSKILNKLTKKYDDNRMVSKYNNSNNLVYIPINKNEITVTYYSGKVYNLSVEDNHTYVVEGLVAHNCYVITPPEDNLESIFECASKLARTYSYGGGCGVDLSKLAPRGAKVNNTAKETSGAVSFMDLYNTVTGLIGQNGRRGALMLSISCEHPDLEEFISIKSDLNKITKANISVRITDNFMEAVQNRQPFTLNFTREATGEVITKEIDAYAIFHKLCEMNWDYAEPGMLFWDRIENWNLLSEDESFHYAGTNPCAEEPLPAGGSCLLGSINLSEFATPDGNFDYQEFSATVRVAVKALDDVLSEGLALHPLEEQQDSVRDWRQIGLGIFGLADLLIKMGVRYGSPEAVKLCDTIGRTMAEVAILTSNELGDEKGCYPQFKDEQVLKSPYLKKHYCLDKLNLRHSQLLTIAPTGTLSTMLGVSGGIEPIYANSYTRKTESLHGHDEYYKVYTPIVQKYMEAHGLTEEEQLPNYFVTAQTLDFKERIQMQAIWQQHIDASISSTINVPNDFTVEQTEELYITAWEQGLKGVTIFRDGCARVGVLTTSNDNSAEPKELPRGFVIKANNNCIGKKRTLYTGCGTLHCEAFFDPSTGDLLETYLSKGSSGGCNNYMIGLSRMVSLAARGGLDIYAIVDQLKSSGTCPSYAVRKATKHDTSEGSSCPVAVGNALIEMYNELQMELKNKTGYAAAANAQPQVDTKQKPQKTCPECGAEIFFEGGCNTCKNCGWSKCN